MSNIELLPNIADEQLMQLLGNQHYMMTDERHLNENDRNVNQMHSESHNSGHNSTHSINQMDRHSVESCNYVSNQYETQYHDSSDSQNRYKYRSSGLSTVSETVTHVSETDNSMNAQNNYGSVGTSVTNINVQQNYPMNSLNNWNQSHNNINANQIRAPKEMTAINIHHKVTPQTCYIPRQRISNYVQNVSSMAPSTTSTPVNQTLNNMINNNNHINTDNNNNKNHSLLSNQELQQTNKIDFINMVEKRTVITFRVVDQIVDLSGKVLKETVIKDEEVIKNLGKFEWNEGMTDSVTPQSSISSVSRFTSNTNSGVLADVSSSIKSSSSSALLDNQHNQTNENLIKNSSTNDEFFNKIPTPIQRNITINTMNTSFTKENSDLNRKFNLEMRSPVTSSKHINENINSISGKKGVQELISSDIEEEERRETATALLSLQTQRSLNIDCNSDQMSFKNVSLRPGNRVMAKWRDKNFYPAVISKYLNQNNKWSVTFEDKATRSLFVTELIQIECLSEGQDVMVSISDGFCVKAIIKNVIREENNVFFEVEHLKDDKKVLKRYFLKDLFLNAEQGANIALKSAKPALNGAVFADVDLDNIVSGKRARITKQENINTEKPIQIFKNGRRRPADSTLADADYVNDDEEEEDDNFPIKSKKKAINVRTNKKKIESLHTNFHSEHSLSISPRTTKASISMPPLELIKLLGPLPELGSNIFNGVSFLLTCGDRNKCDDLCLEQSNPERSTPFDKLYLIKQIESGGGKVFETFEEMKNCEENVDIVLIADTYHRSIKYIQCLAAGIPIASHLWVIDCCRQNKFLKRDNYTLPAGFSIITNALPSDKNTFRKSSTLFKGTKFYFGSKTPEKLQSLWSPVLSAAHSVIVEHNPSLANTLSRKTVDIIIGDHSCPSELVKKAKQMKIPVISSEYIVQCLINGRKLSYDASPLFSYTYKNNSNL